MKFKPNNFISKIAILLIFQFLFAFNGKTQMISQNPSDYPAGTTFSNCPGGSCVISLPAARFNQDYDITIPVTVPITTHVFTPSNSSGSCTEITDNHTLTNSANLVEFKVTQRCPTGTANSFSFTLNVDDGVNPPEHQDFFIPIIRDTVKLVLVLDISGSMSLPVQGTTDARIDALKTAVYGLVPKLEELQQGLGDSLSLTYFSSSVIDPNLSVFNDFVVIDNTDASPANWSFSKVFADLDPRTPQQMTAMGEGLLDAKNKLKLDSSPNLKRLVFLFTDGLQNYGNQLKPDGMSFYDTNDSLNNHSANPKDSIQYFPVATWGAGAQPVILQEIANNSDGEVLFVTPATDLTDWFNTQLSNMLDQGSPQIVLNKSMNSLSGETTIPFKLNEHVNTLLIQLNSKDTVDLAVFKESNNLNSKARVRNGNGFTIVSYKFPIMGDPATHSGGDWEIKLNGNTDNPINVSVIADDHYLDYNCATDKELYTVGDVIHLRTSISHNGNPVTTSGNTVTAIVLKPGDDLGDMLSNYETPDFDDSLIDIESGAAQKFNELMMNDSSFFNALLPEEQVINLTDDGNGNFTGQFSSTELAGFYNIIYLLEGEIANFGNFKRRKTKSIVFEFGQVEEEKPEEVKDAPPASSGSNKNFTVLKIRPRNKYGKFMGPGFKSKISLKINPKNVTAHKTAMTQESNEIRAPYLSEMKDNLDGSYYLYIANITDMDKWDFSVMVGDEVLYDYSGSIPWWVYLVAFLLLLLIYLVKKSKAAKVFFWILLIIWLVVIILHYLGYISFL